MLLISDANIFIDLDKIWLLSICAKLSHQIVTTDFVYNELYKEQRKVLDDLNIKQLTFEGDEIIDFYTKYSILGNVGISPQDYSLIYKAKKIKGSIVTGDKALRNYIKKENLDVFGIFFIFDEILNEELLPLNVWKIKLEELKNLNDRLPKKEFEKRLWIMKQAILIGTSHNIQRGELHTNEFKIYLEELCGKHNISAIAEEIDNRCVSIASKIASERDMHYKIIEPTPEEAKQLGIEQVHLIEYEFMNRYDIPNWSNEPSITTLGQKIYELFDNRVQTTYRQWESEWLKRINNLNCWPVLIICGATHFEPFANLLIENDIDTQKECSGWGVWV